MMELMEMSPSKVHEAFPASWVDAVLHAAVTVCPPASIMWARPHQSDPAVLTRRTITATARVLLQARAAAFGHVHHVTGFGRGYSAGDVIAFFALDEEAACYEFHTHVRRPHLSAAQAVTALRGLSSGICMMPDWASSEAAAIVAALRENLLRVSGGEAAELGLAELDYALPDSRLPRPGRSASTGDGFVPPDITPF